MSVINHGGLKPLPWPWEGMRLCQVNVIVLSSITKKMTYWQTLCSPLLLQTPSFQEEATANEILNSVSSMRQSQLFLEENSGMVHPNPLTRNMSHGWHSLWELILVPSPHCENQSMLGSTGCAAAPAANLRPSYAVWCMLGVSRKETSLLSREHTAVLFLVAAAWWEDHTTQKLPNTVANMLGVGLNCGRHKSNIPMPQLVYLTLSLLLILVWTPDNWLAI